MCSSCIMVFILYHVFIMYCGVHIVLCVHNVHKGAHIVLSCFYCVVLLCSCCIVVFISYCFHDVR